MSQRKQVVWRDGLFMKPHHFQQQQRYLEHFVEDRIFAMDPYRTGLLSIEINRDNLVHSKFSILSAVGQMPDGTVIDIPRSAQAPIPLDLSEGAISNERIYLALPHRSSGVAEIDDPEQPSEHARMRAVSEEIRDNATFDTVPHFVDLGECNFRLMSEREDRSSYTYLPIARVRERRADGSLELDRKFLPTAVAVEALPGISEALEDFCGLLQQKAENLAVRIGSSGQGGVSEVSDFMMLQLLNRLWPQFRHAAKLRHLHPRELYGLLTTAAGEMATFTAPNRLSPDWPTYDHVQPELCFNSVISQLRQSLTTFIDANAIALALQKLKYGILTAPLPSSDLIQSSTFVLSVRAAMPMDKLAKEFPAQTKVSSVENIRQLINLHLPGIILQQLPTAPRQLPYHAGFIYYQLDSNSPAWDKMRDASGFALHVAGNFPELEIQFWAIRNEGNA